MLSARISTLLQNYRQECLQESCQKARQEIRQEALQEGIKEGIQKGVQEGLEKGQQQERLRIASSLLDVIADDNLLANKTGLSEIEIHKLRLITTTKN